MKTVQQSNGKKTRIRTEIRTDIKNKKLKKTFVICLVLFFAISYSEYSQLKKTSLRFLDREGNEHVLSLPLRDKKRLFCFMRMLFAEDSFAYTLIGSKPVSWACFKSPFPFDDFSFFVDSFKKRSRSLRLGWKTWLKYRHLFPAARFWAEQRVHSGWTSILLVNEEKFNQVVKDNIRDFQAVLNRDIEDGNQLLREAQNRPLMGELLKGHQALLGIVLGYGRDNSWDFLQGIETNHLLGWVWDESEFPETGVKIRLAATNIEDCLAIESCPSFAGNPHSEESLALKREYLLTKQKIIDYYKGKDFLEATLSLLAGFRPVE